jgi:hypothetical protein
MNIQNALEIFNEYYSVDDASTQRIPTSVVFNRISSELNLPRLSNIEMSELIATYDLEKRSTTYSNYRNSLLDKITDGSIFKTITKEFKKEFIKKYNNQDRIVINAFTNIVEKTVPDNFIKNKLQLIHGINTTKNNEELLELLKEYIENNEECGIITMIENKKKKDESVFRINEQKIIKFQ